MYVHTTFMLLITAVALSFLNESFYNMSRLNAYLPNYPGYVNTQKIKPKLVCQLNYCK